MSLWQHAGFMASGHCRSLEPLVCPHILARWRALWCLDRHCDKENCGVGFPGSRRTCSVHYVDVATSVAAVAAVGGLLYSRQSALHARESARLGRGAIASAQRAVHVVSSSTRSAERARFRHRVERVGELVHEVYFSSQVDPGVDGLSQRTRGQCDVLNQAVIGLKNTLPKTADVYRARSPGELRERAGIACVEIDGVLAGLSATRSGNRGRRPSSHASRTPWHR